MARPVRKLSNMEIDEISLVDKGANQHAMITIAKRAPEEDEMPEIYTEDGQPLSEDDLKHGDVVYDEAGNAYEYVEEAEDAPVAVGKSAFFEKAPQTGFAQSVMEELSKAFSDTDRDAVIAKALGRVDELEAQQRKFEEIAKSERDLRLTREYISKAAEYNLPVDSNELGPVLFRMAETMTYDDCAVIAKCLETAGTILFEEAGYRGGGENADVMSMVEGYALQEVGKSAESGATGRPTAEAISKVFDENPQAYDEYLASQRTRF